MSFGLRLRLALSLRTCWALSLGIASALSLALRLRMSLRRCCGRAALGRALALRLRRAALAALVTLAIARHRETPVGVEDVEEVAAGIVEGLRVPRIHRRYGGWIVDALRGQEYRPGVEPRHRDDKTQL